MTNTARAMMIRTGAERAVPPYVPLPALLLLTDEGDVDEGQPITYTLTVDWQGESPVDFWTYIRFPPSLVAPPALAGSSDFTGPDPEEPGGGLIADALALAASLTPGMTFQDMGGSEALRFKLSFAVASFSGTAEIIRYSKDFPAVFQADKQTGFELHNPGTDYPNRTIAVFSPPTVVIIRDVPGVTNVNLPTISDTTPAVDQIITCNSVFADWTPTPTVLSYQWQRGTTDIPGATSADYLVTGVDVGSGLRCGVRASGATGGRSSVVVYSATTTVVPNPTPVSTGVGVVSHDGWYMPPSPPGAIIGQPAPAGGGAVASWAITGQRSPWGAWSQNVWDSFPTDALLAKSGNDLVVATGKTVDFVGPDLNFFGDGINWGPGGIPWFEVRILFTMAVGPTIEQIFRLRPIYSLITPTGDPTANEQLVAGLEPTGTNRFCSLIGNASPNRTIKVPAGIVGVVERNANAGTDIIAHHLTIIGHKKFIAIKDYAPRIFGAGGHHLYFKDMAWRAGGDAVGRDIASDRDSFVIATGYELYHENCEFSANADEVCSMGRSWQPLQPYCHRILFIFCLFAEPLWAPVHRSEPQELSHPYGLLMNDYSAEVHMVFCMMLGFEQRTPAVLKCSGIYVANCILSAGGNSCIGLFNHYGDDVLYPTYTTAIFENNLIKCAYGAHEGVTFYLSSCGVGTEVYQAGNHFIGRVNEMPRFDDIAIPSPVPTGFIKFKGSTASAAAFRSYRPFLINGDYGLKPTATQQNRSDLFDYVRLRVGVRDRDGSGNLILGDAAMSEIGARHVNDFCNCTNRAPIETERYASPTVLYSFGAGGANTGSVLPSLLSGGGIARPQFPAAMCPAGPAGDACRAAGGFPTGNAGDTWPLL